jgi:hypothetical protein
MSDLNYILRPTLERLLKRTNPDNCKEMINLKNPIIGDRYIYNSETGLTVLLASELGKKLELDNTTN